MKYLFFGLLAMMINLSAALPSENAEERILEETSWASGHCRIDSGTSIIYISWDDTTTRIDRWSLSSGSVTTTIYGDDRGRAMCNVKLK